MTAKKLDQSVQIFFGWQTPGNMRALSMTVSLFKDGQSQVFYLLRYLVSSLFTLWPNPWPGHFTTIYPKAQKQSHWIYWAWGDLRGKVWILFCWEHYSCSAYYFSNPHKQLVCCSGFGRWWYLSSPHQHEINSCSSYNRGTVTLLSHLFILALLISIFTSLILFIHSWLPLPSPLPSLGVSCSNSLCFALLNTSYLSISFLLSSKSEPKTCLSRYWNTCLHLGAGRLLMSSTLASKKFLNNAPSPLMKPSELSWVRTRQYNWLWSENEV